MALTPATIAAALRVNPVAVANNWPLIVAALVEFGINTDLVQVAAAATVGTEVPAFEPICELGPANYFNRYDGRADLGNVQRGDGYRFRGRGFIQLTGRANYLAAGVALGLDLVGNPNAVLEPRIAAWLLAWYFKTRHVAEAADAQEWFKARLRVNGLNRKTGQPNGWPRFSHLVEVLRAA